MNTLLYPLFGTLFTFLMTTLGSALVFFFKDEIKDFYQQLFLGFAAGIMIAASVWSLLIPSMEMAEANGQNSALILGGGFIIGALFLLFLDHVIPHQHLNEDKPEGPKSMLGKNTMLVLAVTLHNIPEGFAVGLTFAIAASNSSITFASALALALGIGLQNLPEGAAISLPLKQEGMSRTKAFVYGSLSGIVEPIAGVIAGFTIHIMQTILPICLSFAAGAMMYVVVEELIPATCLLITKFLLSNETLKISLNGATALYTGTITDTGNFRYRGVNAETFHLAGVLLNYGVDTEWIDQNLSVQSLRSLRLKSYVYRSFKVTKNGFAYAVINRMIIKYYNVGYDEAASLVNLLANIKECPVWALIIRYPKDIRVRIRSNGPNINKLAEKYDGGGHHKAAGASLKSWSKMRPFVKDADALVKEYKESQDTFIK